ncbi:hypothetical protein GCM10023081_33620 [Arthrobacter ginkgonis]|uniref:Aminoglycoside phosphotransferase domain-containing protein n=1 Tax=Arthrobacter ginkgonis TaxID=1630594 RepID=A0ABP7CSN6_9MICC
MARPPLPAETALAAEIFPGPDWASGTVEEGGQSHLVLVARGEAVLRMARTPEAAADLGRRSALVDELAPQLPYRLPRTLAPPWRAGGRAAVVQEYVPGAAHPPHGLAHCDPAHCGDARVLAALVRDLASVDVGPLRPLLAEPFAFRGAWTAEKTAAVLAALPAGLAADAATVVEAVRAFADAADGWGPDAPPGTAGLVGLVHGDLAGCNMHWAEGRVVGILDWDLAAAWDPALNAAYLGLWHGRDVLPAIARDAGEAARAEVWIGAMGLDALHDALQRTDNPKLGKLLRKVAPRIRLAAQAADAAQDSVGAGVR